MDLKTQFHNDMVDIFKKANKFGYNPKAFFKVVSDMGGYEAAKGFISKPGGTSGFSRLYEMGKLELSVENLVLQEKYHELFTDQEREVCIQRLQDNGFKVDIKPVKRNPNWTRDELILALDLYFRVNPLQASDKHSDIINLSELLNKLPIHPERQDNEKFRNPNGVYMKLCNFLSIDPSYQGTGLSASSKLDVEIWNEYAGDREKLAKTAKAIVNNYKDISAEKNFIQVYDSDDEEFSEGRILTRIHKMRERNTTIIRKKKENVLQECGILKCEVCNFDFYKFYGNIGKEFIECHHTKPVSDLIEGEMTKISELALVCSNCHRMLHRTNPLLSIAQLKEQIYSNNL